MDINSIIWIAAAVILGIIESVTTNLVTIWVAVSAVCSAVAAAFGLGFLSQMLIFVGVSAVLLLVTRPLSLRLLKRKREPTNADRLVGKKALVIKKIDPIENTGQVKVLGQVWSALSEDSRPIEEGEITVVTEIRGVKAVVKKTDNVSDNKRER